MKKKVMLTTFLVGVFVLSFTVTGAIAEFPEKPINMMVQFSAGGTTDLTLRILSSIASEQLGQPIVVTNKPGGGGAVAYGILKKAKPDGYTLCGFSPSGSVVGPHVRQVPFETKKDFDFLLQYAEYFQGFAVRTDAPFDTMAEFLDYGKEHPDKATYSTAGANSAQFLVMEMVAQQANVELIHVPYKGGAPAVAACLGGHVTGVAAAEITEQVKAGKFKLLAVFKEKRAKDFPDVPTLRELGYNVPTLFYVGIVGPKGIPAKRLEILQNAFKKGLDKKSFIKLLDRFNMSPVYRGSDDFRNLVFNHYDLVGKILRDLGIARK